MIDGTQKVDRAIIVASFSCSDQEFKMFKPFNRSAPLKRFE